MGLIEDIKKMIDEKRTAYQALSEQVWTFAELHFGEVKSASLLSKALENEGFHVAQGIAGLKTGFVGSYGHGKPVIAFLGEFDALAGLSQKRDRTVHDPIVLNGNGHGCGHNLLGVGSLAAAFAVKEYLIKHGLKGTVRYYGCPAEESGNGKAYMAREGCFKDVDAAFSWHPDSRNAVQHLSSNAVIEARFTFKGISAHAAALPELGRSALDALELMNIGVNYLREHMEEHARIHYAVTNTGGVSPNVVQAIAEERFLVRSPQPSAVKKLFERVVNIAKGAALMTGTEMSYQIEGGCCNLIPNKTLHQVMADFMEKIGFPKPSERDLAFLKDIYTSIGDNEKNFAKQFLTPDQRDQIAEKPIADWVIPCPAEDQFMTGSTDVSDVSWNVPTAQCFTATWAFATVPHTWQVVAQGTQDYALNAALYAGQAMACTAIKTIEDPDLLADATREFKERLGGETYECLIPADVKPPVH
ncbi:M20 family metallopeptidase [Sporolactobacillus sp. CPB3-1]|uniref:M20 family metallopeptidase n=1 Tax=Sporolactobacillus mangiferae TaxID=2940498 RepID=A0ABT0MAB7_9BACL|nr:M20 family metallopeptidase [Sporolactobacillus mangiferae]MCL1631528.1 M20 family metallopeptidase [Sporolactobacillus mangiferae]